MSDDALKIVEENANETRRSIMGRLSIVEHELGQIAGELEDLPPLPLDAEIGVALMEAQRAVMLLRVQLLSKGWR